MQDKRAKAESSSFGQRVKQRREQVGWTQQQLSDKLALYGLKLDTSAITRIENGSREPRLREAQMLAHILDAKLDDLVPSTPSNLLVVKLWDDLDMAQSVLVGSVYDYGVARRALNAMLDELDGQGADVEHYDEMRADAARRAVADWAAIKADHDARVRIDPPNDESVFDAET